MLLPFALAAEAFSISAYHVNCTLCPDAYLIKGILSKVCLTPEGSKQHLVLLYISNSIPVPGSKAIQDAYPQT